MKPATDNLNAEQVKQCEHCNQQEEIPTKQTINGKTVWICFTCYSDYWARLRA